MNFDLFYEQCLQNQINSAQLNTFFKTVLDEFDGKPAKFQDIDVACRLFYGKSENMSKATFYRNRVLVRALYDWLYEQGAVSEKMRQAVYALQLRDVISDHELSLHYFRNLDEALNFVEMIGVHQGLEGKDDMLNYKAMVVLAWHGIELQQSLSIRKADIYRESKSVVCCDKVFHFEEKYFNIICRFADIDVHKGFPSGKTQFYCDSPYLMRSAKQERMNMNSLKCALQRFNGISKSYNKALSILALRRNGIFSRIINSKDEKCVNALIREEIQCDTAFACGYKELYERWKQWMEVK